MLPVGSLRLTALASFILASALPVQAGVPLPNGGRGEKVDFERHLMGLLGRMGCNSGSCHGSFQGKNGFRLSLFGYEPEKDYFALTRDLQARRIDGSDPDNSPLPLKATGQIDHRGGPRLRKDSWR